MTKKYINILILVLSFIKSLSAQIIPRPPTDFLWPRAEFRYEAPTSLEKNNNFGC